MRPFYLLLFFLLVFSGVTAQPGSSDKLKTKKISKSHPDHTASYTILQKGNQVKHGPYNMAGRNWKAEGQYETGKRAGVWTFYGWKGELEHKFDFTTNKMLFSSIKEDTSKTEVYLNGAFVKMKTDSRPFLFGGNGRMLSFLGRTIRYPADAHRAGIQGMAVISMEIDEAGKATNFAITQKVGYGIDEEALRVVRLLPNEWVPAMLNGAPVKSRFYLPIRFAMH